MSTLMPKFSFKSGFVASGIAFVIGFIVWPLIYSHFGEGAQLTRNAVVSSVDLKKDCGEVKDFLIIPWQLSLNDSDTSGDLQIGYWFKCGGDFSTVKAKFHHHGGGWIAEEIDVHTSKQNFKLAPNQLPAR